MTRFMLVLAMLVLVGMAAAQGGDTLPKESEYHDASRRADPVNMKTGDYACVFGVGASVERHLWVSPDEFTFSPHCAMRAQKLKDGWKIWLLGIPIEVGPDEDAFYNRLGWIRFTEVVR